MQSVLQVAVYESGIRLFWIRLSNFVEEWNVFRMARNETQPMSLNDQRTSSMFFVVVYGLSFALICILIESVYIIIAESRFEQTIVLFRQFAFKLISFSPGTIFNRQREKVEQYSTMQIEVKPITELCH